MAVRIGCGLSTALDPRQAALAAAAVGAGRARRPGRRRRRRLLLGAAPRGARSRRSTRVAAALAPTALVGCGAGGVLGGGREVEGGTGVAVWAATLDGGRARGVLGRDRRGAGRRLGHRPARPRRRGGGDPAARPGRLPDRPGAAASSGAARRASPSWAGSRAPAGAAASVPLFVDDEVVTGGAVGLRLDGVEVLPCVSQGASPVGPELTVTAAEGNVISELDGRAGARGAPRRARGACRASERALLGGGLLLGIVVARGHPDLPQRRLPRARPARRRPRGGHRGRRRAGRGRDRRAPARPRRRLRRPRPARRAASCAARPSAGRPRRARSSSPATGAGAGCSAPPTTTPPPSSTSWAARRPPGSSPPARSGPSAGGRGFTASRPPWQSSPCMNLSGRSVLLTGATGGIGHALARAPRTAPARRSSSPAVAPTCSSRWPPRSAAARCPSTWPTAPRSSELARDLRRRRRPRRQRGAAGRRATCSTSPSTRSTGPSTSTSARRSCSRALLGRAHGGARRPATSSSSPRSPGRSGTGGSSALLRHEVRPARLRARACAPTCAPSGVGVSVVFPGFIRDAGMFHESGTKLPQVRRHEHARRGGRRGRARDRAQPRRGRRRPARHAGRHDARRRRARG